MPARAVAETVLLVEHALRLHERARSNAEQALAQDRLRALERGQSSAVGGFLPEQRQAAALES